MVGQVFSSIAHLQHSQQQQWGSNPQYGYYGGYAYGQTGVPGQPGSHVHQSGHHDQNGHAGQWDSAAAQAFYQSGGGWGNYYGESKTL
jgi:nucleolysin TIA-1/TIAR